MSIIKQLWRKYGINPFDSLLKRAALRGDSRFLICWNRGLGDIPLGLYALTQRIYQYIPHADITFVTRLDLVDGFRMLEGVHVVADPDWKRGVAFDLEKTFLNTGLKPLDFDVILEKPDPTHWLMWQLGKVVPKLKWAPEWDALCERFSLEKGRSYIGVHAQTETNYAYEKNWPEEYMRAFFKRVYLEYGVPILLFGFAPNPLFAEEGIIDLRGKTSLFEMLSIIKNCCRYLLVPDSGVLSIAYYIDASFPIDIVSLWADPRQGILKQNVSSPNPLLKHRPLIAKDKDLRTVSVESTLQALFEKDCKTRIHELLSQLDQLHLFEGVEDVSEEAQEFFLKQLQHYSLPLRDKQKQVLFPQEKSEQPTYAPCTQFENSGSEEDYKKGLELLEQGKAGCLILAGGQGTRLGFEGPKGAFPILGKSLFQILCEKVKAASLQVGRNLPLCIMTSQLNHTETIDFFQRHNYFGLDFSQVSFFQQKTLPFIDDNGNWLLEVPGKVAEGPDGNGHALHCFYETGLWEKWKAIGVEYLNVIFVDNVLGDPFDPEFLGFAARKNVDAAAKTIRRLHPAEKMGVLVEIEGRLKVIEYTEIPPAIREGSEFALANTGMFCIAMPFIAHLCGELKAEFPLHPARKTAQIASGEKVSICKCERFLFDLLDYARSSAVLVYPREKIFAPLKNASGEDSPERIEKVLQLQK